MGPEGVAGDKFGLGSILDHGTLLFGRRTWDHFRTLWPPRDNAFARAMDGATKAVVTSRPVDESGWAHSRAIDAPLADWVRREVTGTDIVVIGSMSGGGPTGRAASGSGVPAAAVPDRAARRPRAGRTVERKAGAVTGMRRTGWTGVLSTLEVA